MISLKNSQSIPLNHWFVKIFVGNGKLEYSYQYLVALGLVIVMVAIVIVSDRYS